MEVDLLYGRGLLTIDIPQKQTFVIRPGHVPVLEDAYQAIRQSLISPIGSIPLKDLVSSDDYVAIVFSDITRPIPYQVVLPALLDELRYVDEENIVLINALGSHRPNTYEELCGILGADVVRRYRIEQHDCNDKDRMCCLGKTSRGNDVWINRRYMDSSVKILTGFIEPHLFAGFSGGPKSVMPGIAGIESIGGNHSTQNISNTGVGYGVTVGNPIWEEMYEIALKTEPSFIVNITQTETRNITGVFSGSLTDAHKAGIEFVKKTAMMAVDNPFDIVITTAGGYPLDISLYQSVKGIAAAGRIVRKGGAILLATECYEGMPKFGGYAELLQMAESPAHLLKLLSSPGFFMQDQWDAQIQAGICQDASLHIYAEGLSDEEIRCGFGIPCRDIQQTLEMLLSQYGRDARVAVLPSGPFSIPYVHTESTRISH